MGSYFISELNRSDSILSATVVTDIAALLLLISVLIYTGTYRKRGKFEDRLFFAMIILDMVSAVSDALNSVFEQLNIMELKYSVLRLARGLGGQKSYGLTVSIGGKMGNDTGIGTGVMEQETAGGLEDHHCYTVLGVENIDGEDMIRLRNPHGTDIADPIYNEHTGAVHMTHAKFNEVTGGSFVYPQREFFRMFRYYARINLV